jgi:hypothetical protein
MKNPGRKKGKKRALKIKDELKQFFPPVDRMTITIPTDWGQVKPATSSKSQKKAVNSRTL